MVVNPPQARRHGAGVIVVSSSPGFILFLLLFYFAAPTQAGVSATGDVDPADPTTWTDETDVYVGNTGEGEVCVDDGSAIETVHVYLGYSSDATGTVTVDGAGSTWENAGLAVGTSGSGSLDITNGGTVTNNSGVHIGMEAGSTGEVTVDGADSTLTNHWTLTIGDNGDGTLNITSGGYVSAKGALGFGGARIGENTGSTGVVNIDGTDSMLESSVLSVGSSGNGTLNITNGANSSGLGTYIGYEIGSTGEVFVEGEGSSWTSLVLDVGYSGDGTLNIMDGAAVNSSIGYIGHESGSMGEVTVDGSGSTWESTSLYVGYNDNGTLTITDGGLVSVSGTLTINYDSDGDGFINMSTGGMLALDGEADDSLAAFLGLVEGTDEIRYWDDDASDWVDILAAVYGRDYTLAYLTEGDLAGYTVLTVERALNGDANVDGIVDVSDLGILATNYGTTGGVGWLEGDFNLDGVVDVSDLGILATNYGLTGAAPVGLPSTTPEPATLSFLALGGVALLRKRSNR